MAQNKKSMKMTSLVQKMTFTLMILAMTLCFTLPVNAQSNHELARIDVVRAIVNGQDISQNAIDNQQCIQLYKQGGDILFTNSFIKAGSKSYGKVYNVEYRSVREKNYSNSEVFHFKWNWINSFDSETGTADVYIKVVTGNEGTAARIIVVSDDLEQILDYAGVIRGSLDGIKK